MPTPSEHKTVQARILAYAEAIGWTIVSRARQPRKGEGAFLPPCVGRSGTGMSPLLCHSSSTTCSTPRCGNFQSEEVCTAEIAKKIWIF